MASVASWNERGQRVRPDLEEASPRQKQGAANAHERANSPGLGRETQSPGGGLPPQAPHPGVVLGPKASAAEDGPGTSKRSCHASRDPVPKGPGATLEGRQLARARTSQARAARRDTLFGNMRVGSGQKPSLARPRQTRRPASLPKRSMNAGASDRSRPSRLPAHAQPRNPRARKTMDPPQATAPDPRLQVPLPRPRSLVKGARANGPAPTVGSTRTLFSSAPVPPGRTPTDPVRPKER